MKQYHLLSAFEKIRNEYIEAKKNQSIHKPLSYALYQTWKFFDVIELSKPVTDIEVNVFNLKEVYNNVTVEVWGNNETGDISVAWYKEGEYDEEQF